MSKPVIVGDFNNSSSLISHTGEILTLNDIINEVDLTVTGYSTQMLKIYPHRPQYFLKT